MSSVERIQRGGGGVMATKRSRVESSRARYRRELKEAREEGARLRAADLDRRAREALPWEGDGADVWY